MGKKIQKKNYAVLYTVLFASCLRFDFLLPLNSINYVASINSRLEALVTTVSSMVMMTIDGKWSLMIMVKRIEDESRLCRENKKAELETLFLAGEEEIEDREWLEKMNCST